MKIAASILSADFSRLAEEVARIEKAHADMIHIDIMDGNFVPNITIGPMVVSALRPLTKLYFDVHLMIADPDRFIDSFVEAGANGITIHAEACKHLHRTIYKIKSRGVKVGVAINPATSLDAVEWVLSDVDSILIMTVNPGFGGQKFIENMLPKIGQLKHMIDNMGLNTEIQVDGGIDLSNVQKVVAAGAISIVSGNAIFKVQSMEDAIRTMRNNVDII